MGDQPKKLVALLSDLMFMVKIQEAAKRAGVEIVFVKSQDEAFERAKEQPALLILDLNHSASDPVGTIAKLKGDPQTSSVSLLGFVLARTSRFDKSRSGKRLRSGDCPLCVLAKPAGNSQPVRSRVNLQRFVQKLGKPQAGALELQPDDRFHAVDIQDRQSVA